MDNASIFEEIASLLTVKTIISPLSPDVQADSTIAEVEDFLDPRTRQDDPYYDPFNNPSRVIEAKGNVVGILWFTNWYSEDAAVTVDEVMDRIEPSEFLSSTTTILDAVEIFSIKNYELFYVIHSNEIIGVLRYRDLFKPTGRLVFLALALEIEDLALRLCESNQFSERCWSAIADNRKQKAIELFKQRYQREPNDKKQIFEASDNIKLLRCTNLVDKANMIWKLKLIPSATRSEILGFFHDLKVIRDKCAHPGDKDVLVPKESLAKFVAAAKAMRRSLHESMNTHGVVQRAD